MIEIEFNLSDMHDEFGEILRRIMNPVPLMAGIAQELVAEAEEQFESESGPNGKWAELKVSTIEQRQKTRNWPGKILQVKGDLASSLHGFHSSHEAGVRAGSGPSDKYAAIHQLGSDARRGHKSKIPARPFLPFILMGNEVRLSDSALDSIVEMTRYYVNGNLI
ncbi:MAG: phage virion morphogenesis protein [Methylomonas sp.]|nr:phage virion morphogenesis protein [Methylomonas sp.]